MTVMLACSGDGGSGDASPPPRESGPDTGADAPFGRACTNIGEKCQDQGYDHDLFCVEMPGGTAGNGFCTPQCTDVGSQCNKVQSGQRADCVLQGSIAKFCAFLCVNGSFSYTCPPALRCGTVNAMGVALCLPR
jgi:hypothetical protein